MGSDTADTTVRLPVWLWVRVIFDLRRKGQGRRESGAFLLGREAATSRRVSAYLPYDVIDPHAYQNGTIQFHAAGYAALWRYCEDRQVRVLADVHTHGDSDVRQSPIDKRHPMVPIIGHTAMIVPNFGKTAWWSLSAVGVYEYLGNFQWRSAPPSAAPRRVKLSLW